MDLPLIRITMSGNFLSERTYAVETLITHYLGIPVDIKVGNHEGYYDLEWEGRRIRIADAFFGKIDPDTSYVQEPFLPKQIEESSHPEFPAWICLYGKADLSITENKIMVATDLFASAFFMLTRWEEALGTHRDHHNRFPAEAALMVKSGFILRPVVDEYTALLKQLLARIGYPVPADKATYKVVPTCDIDIPFFWKGRPLWKTLTSRSLARRHPFSLWKDYQEYQSVKNGYQTDPFDTYDDLMSLAERHNLTMTFYVIGGGQSEYERFYHVSQPHIRDLLKKITARGHRIGLHPSYHAWQDGDVIRAEKEGLEEACGYEVTVTRQHYLRFGVPKTWQALHEAGMQEDSTMGFAAEPGFRCGTSRPFPVFDIRQRRTLPLVERPLLIMDVSLRWYKKMAPAEAKTYCNNIREQVKHHQGDFVWLWHNSNLSPIDGWQNWREVMEALM